MTTDLKTKDFTRQARLNAVKELLVTLNHEIRNPLGAISLAIAQVQTDNKECEPRLREYFEIIAESGRQIEHVLNRLNMVTEPVSTTYVDDIRMLDIEKSTMATYASKNTAKAA